MKDHRIFFLIIIVINLFLWNSSQAQTCGFFLESEDYSKVSLNRKMQILKTKEILESDSPDKLRSLLLIWGLETPKNIYRMNAIIPATSESILEEPRFAPELTFYNPQTLAATNGDEVYYNLVKALHKQFAAKSKKILSQLQHSPVVRLMQHKEFPAFRFTFPDGWWFMISVDPGVFEIQWSPLTTEETEIRKDIIERGIFEAAIKCGLKPARKFGGGHINIDATIFLHNPLLGRNFIADFSNHSELAMGIFGHDRFNALAMSEHPRRTHFRKLMDHWDMNLPNNLRSLITEIHYKVYGRSIKYQALSFKSITQENPKKARIEIRSIRAPLSFQEYMNTIRLLRSRIKFLQTCTTPILTQANPLSDRYLKVQAFRIYVISSGLNWKEYQSMVPKKWLSEFDLIESLLPQSPILSEFWFRLFSVVY